jgi:hypothetical protein
MYETNTQDSEVKCTRTGDIIIEGPIREWYYVRRLVSPFRAFDTECVAVTTSLLAAQAAARLFAI